VIASRPSTRILVWDAATRVFHWLLAFSFLGAWLTSDAERWIDLHALLGYTMIVLVAFRVAWGVVGPRYARFASFACGPRCVLAYLRSLASRRPAHFIGHNPAGSWAIFAMLALVIVAGASGLATYNEIGGDAMEEFHEGAANALLALVVVHVAGVLIGSALHRENLIGSMITGCKAGEPSEAIGTPRRIVAALLAAAVVSIWAGAVPLPGVGADGIATAVKAGAHATRHADDDDD
jgi:cytochrome b